MSNAGRSGEFDFIARHFRPLAGEGSLDLTDDAAVVDVEPGLELILCVDTLVENVHFLPEDPPETVGRKALRVNLSDCAAMGAVPYGYLLSICRPRNLTEEWFAAFARGLAEDQSCYGIHALGGDTTSTAGPLVLSVTLLGKIAKGHAVRRNGALPGDELWVTGTIGDAAMGLKALRGQIPDKDGYFTERYRLPRPRVGFPLFGHVHAAMDVSDGLVQDAGHLARESGASVTIEAANVPLSPQARALKPHDRLECLTGGDDYELLMACPVEAGGTLQQAAHAAGVTVTRIGRFTVGPPTVTVLGSDGRPLEFPNGGWQHF